MRSMCNGTQFYPGSVCNDSVLNKAKQAISDYDANTSKRNINSAIELYNLHLTLSVGRKATDVEGCDTVSKDLLSRTAVYFSGINESNIVTEYQNVGREYLHDFWTLFEKFDVYKRVSDQIFSSLMNDDEHNLSLILENKKVVSHYDNAIGEFMRHSKQTAEIIINKFLERKDYHSKNIYIPKSLNASEYEAILNSYVNSPNPHISYLQLISISLSSAECPISDKLRLSAKKKAEELWKNLPSPSTFTYGVEVSFRDNPQFITYDNSKPLICRLIYDKKWIEEHLDPLTLLSNFIYMFGFVDLHGRCSFPAVKSKLGIFESISGSKGVKEYIVGSAFHLFQMKSSAEMTGYMELLEKNSIDLCDVIHWFFTIYLKDEFSIEGFVINLPPKDASVLSKCKEIPQEMEGILKQFEMYVEDGKIDRELYEMSSKHTVLKDVRSLIRDKYAYSNGDDINREMYDLFSNQSMLSYIAEFGEKYKCAYDLLSSNSVCLYDYPDWEQDEISWLISRGVLIVDSNGSISINQSRALILKDLYDHEVVCPVYYKDRSELDKLISAGDLRTESTLFSVPEQQYFNYILNKSEFSNGLDLDNKYSHSTYPTNIKQQNDDYISLMKILVVYVLKIHEELCLAVDKAGK